MSEVKLPRVAITYCTQCRWMLRAAYFGQELLSTFGNAIGEIALIPATASANQEADGDGEPPSADVQSVLLWDRKAEGGFPETKVLKQRVRDHLEPSRDLGHSDKHGKKGAVKPKESAAAEEQQQSSSNATEAPKEGVEASVKRNPDGSVCEDCR
ncbi:hypothetical protein K490DRAFT_54903 [Saccharata proteae CBS 121410]|uniref:Uncharacterized protein n=1 Tax=Saccharata proteae CBS 121410 TaxID=1314787 RepID=A0A6A5YD62_9PEZI|nr:hypothetical protein K490DRAFT_54903 [Saccharata proteae CBS 121410]